MRTCRLTIEGRVQGVGFRDSLRHEAIRERVRGWVRNRRDGSVEALIAGSDDAIERLVAWCRHGPPVAKVTQLHVVECDATTCDVDDGFEMRPTA